MKVGIVGAGTIVPDFLEASQHIENMQVTSIIGQDNDLKRMEELSLHYHIEYIYTDYQEFLLSDIDIVYIAVPNHLHYTFAKEALQKHKHVIVEKPFTSSYQEAFELIDFAQKHNLMIFEAISNQYLPNYLKTKDLLNQLGNIKIVQLNYSQYSRRYDLFKQGTILPVFDPQKSGGALMDINVYNIHFIVGLFGKPQSIIYSANIEKGIDTSGVLLLEYPHLRCVCIGAKDCSCPVSINIQGDQGFIHSDNPANVYQTFVLGMNSGENTSFSLNQNENRLYYELEYFINLLKQKDFEEIKKANQHTLDVMAILDEARSQVNIEWRKDIC